MDEIHQLIFQTIQAADGINIIYTPKRKEGGFEINNRIIHAVFYSNKKIPLSTALFSFIYGILPKPNAQHILQERDVHDWVTPQGLKAILYDSEFPIRFNNKSIHHQHKSQCIQWRISDFGPWFTNGDNEWYRINKVYRFVLPHPTTEGYLWSQDYMNCYNEQKEQLHYMLTEPDLIIAWINYFINIDQNGMLKYKLKISKNNIYTFAHIDYWSIIIGEKYGYSYILEKFMPLKTVGYCSVCKKVVRVNSKHDKETQESLCVSPIEYPDEAKINMITVDCKEKNHQPCLLVKPDVEERWKLLIIYRDYQSYKGNIAELISEKCVA